MRGIAGADFISVKSLRFSTQEKRSGVVTSIIWAGHFMRRIPFSGTQIVTYLENQVVFLTSRLKGIVAVSLPTPGTCRNFQCCMGT